MKKIILSLAMALSSYCSYAQWNGAPGDIYYNTGNVGIGTNVPKNILDLANGTGGRGITWSINGDNMMRFIHRTVVQD
ncbi:MAG TPA: hypothetical protein VL442_04895 [Mucilaginibacter sp.]|jgi:hypothetical protein|nr:hypothetical protein [Mucilaginibacter sp.]